MKIRLRLISSLVLLTLTYQSYAQLWYPIIIPYTTAPKILYESAPLDANYIPWTKSGIDTNLFRGIRKNSEKQDFYISFYSRPELKEEKIGNTKYSYFTNASYIYALNSWVNEQSENPNINKICQLEFDVMEMCSRKAIIDYNTKGSMRIEDYYATYDNEFKRFINAFENTTNNGRDTDKLNELSDSIRRGSSTLKFDPVATVANLNEEKGWMLNYGLTMHMPLSDYVNTGYGFGLNAGFINKKNVYGFDINIEGFETCKRDIVTSKGVIHEGERMLSGEISLYYGYRATSNKSINFTPFVNTGVRFYDGVAPAYPKYNYENNEKSGFTLGAGLMVDIPLSKKVHIRVYDKDIVRRSTSAIRIKPNVSMTSFSGDMGMTPSFNLSLEYSYSIINLK